MGDRAKTNRAILILLACGALGVAALGIWGMTRPAAEQAKATTAAPARMETAQVKGEVRRLLAELDSFKSLEGFHSGAFSAARGLPQAARWHAEATALRDRISGDSSLPPQLRAAPGQLLGLGLTYQQSKGAETPATRGDRAMVTEALK